jgi:hypothetical protein
MIFLEFELKLSSTAAAQHSLGHPDEGVRVYVGSPGRTKFVRAIRVLLCALREIFDESAYSRFLSRHGISSCQQAYAAFLREQEGIKARRPKCC